MNPRHVLILASQTIGEPGTDAGPDEGVAARVQFQQGRSVTGVGGMHGLDETEVIHEFGHVGEIAR